VALRAPYFGSTLSAVGGLTDAFLSFVMPPLIFRVAMRGELGPYRTSFYLSIVVWGLVVIGYTLNRVLGLSAAVIIGKYSALVVLYTIRQYSMGVYNLSTATTSLQLQA